MARSSNKAWGVEILIFSIWKILQAGSLGQVASYQPVTKVLLIIVNDFVNVPGHEIEIRVGME